MYVLKLTPQIGWFHTKNHCKNLGPNCSAESVLMHLDWAPQADAGTARPQVQWQNARCVTVQVDDLLEHWIQKRGNTLPTQLLTSFIWWSTSNAIIIRSNKAKKDVFYGLFLLKIALCSGRHSRKYDARVRVLDSM